MVIRRRSKIKEIVMGNGEKKRLESDVQREIFLSTVRLVTVFVIEHSNSPHTRKIMKNITKIMTMGK
jgi:hypothetical protein